MTITPSIHLTKKKKKKDGVLVLRMICEKKHSQSFPKSWPAALLLPGSRCCMGSSKGRV